MDNSKIGERLEELESLVREQQETIENQRDKIAELERSSGIGQPDVPISRRNTLLAGGILGLLGLGAGTTAANTTPTGRIGTEDRPLEELNTHQIHAPGSDLGVTTGDGDRALTLGEPGIDPEENQAGGNVIAGFEENDVEDSIGSVISGGGGSGEGGEKWARSNSNMVKSNYSTISGGRGNIIGDPSEHQEMPADQSRGSVIGGGEQNAIFGYNSTIGGGWDNFVPGIGATVGGGVWNISGGEQSVIGGGFWNEALGESSVISGGFRNEAIGDSSVIGGGRSNDAGYREHLESGETVQGGEFTSIIGGERNEVYHDHGIIGGGESNTIGDNQDDDSTIASHAGILGGEENEVTGDHSVIPGGQENTVSGSHSFAFGHNATAIHDGAFVIGNSDGEDAVVSESADEARFQTSVVAENDCKFEAAEDDGTVQQTAGPVAKGIIDWPDDQAASGVNIDSVVGGPPTEITLDSNVSVENIDELMTIATPYATFEQPISARHEFNEDGDIIVEVHFNPDIGRFQFVTYNVPLIAQD